MPSTHSSQREDNCKLRVSVREYKCIYNLYVPLCQQSVCECVNIMYITL
uniref:Uncharacterized protein n=1 Tax=Anguilla anguilla TaxID=7936 RepID=A0A0E9VJF6_ANGAN